MSSIRTRTRRDGTQAHALLWREGSAQKTLTFEDYDAADRYKEILDRAGSEQMLKVLARETGVTQGKEEPTVEQWCRRYITTLTGITKGTRDDYERYVRRDIGGRALGTMPLSATLDDDAIPAWVNELGTVNAPKTIWNKHGFLHAALAAAVPKYLTRNPCENTRLPQRHELEMTFLEPDEFALLVGAMTDRWKPLTNFLVMSGARFGEVTALDVADIDPDKLTCRISKAWKYDGDSHPVLGPPKTKKGRRTINIPAEALAGLGLDRSRDELVFHTQAGPRAPIRRRLYRQAWTRTLGKLGGSIGGKEPRPHDLRHTCASWMMNAGVPLPAIQAHLGHESIMTTIGTYSHLDRSAGSKAAAAISAAMSAHRE